MCNMTLTWMDDMNGWEQVSWGDWKENSGVSLRVLRAVQAGAGKEELFKVFEGAREPLADWPLP